MRSRGDENEGATKPGRAERQRHRLLALIFHLGGRAHTVRAEKASRTKNITNARRVDGARNGMPLI